MVVGRDVSAEGAQKGKEHTGSASASSSSALKLTIHSSKPLTTTKPKPKPVFNRFNDDDDDHDGPEQTTPASVGKTSQRLSDKKQSKMAVPIIPNSSTKLSRQQKMAQEQATQVDATIFEYDQVYDLMKSAENKIKAEKESKGAERKPQYISGLIETAKQRKIDRVRAEDKMVQREREAEGEEFSNKDEFVTPAYLQQQKELRETEEAEKLKQESGPTQKTMTTFYQNILEENSKRNEAAMKAVASATITNNPKPSNSVSLGLSATLSKVASDSVPNPQPQRYDPEPEAVPSEAKLAAEVGKKLGRKVDLDDEGRIVDHRQLLTGGLNLGPPKLVVGPAKPKKIGFALPISERKAQEEKEKALRESEKKKRDDEQDDEGEEEGLSQVEKLKLSRERQSILLQQQLIALETNKRKLEEDSRLENIIKVARRNDESKIQLLKQQALKRRQERQNALKESQSHS